MKKHFFKIKEKCDLNGRHFFCKSSSFVRNLLKKKSVTFIGFCKESIIVAIVTSFRCETKDFSVSFDICEINCKYFQSIHFF